MAATPRCAASRPAGAALLVALLVLALAGCSLGSGGDDDASAPATAGPTGAAATTTQAAELRAALTYHLTLRVHLVLDHVRALRAAGGRRDEPGVVAARSALVESADATVEVLAASYSDARPELGPALRAHDTALLAHTEQLVAGQEGDLEPLTARRDDLSAAVRKVVPRLRAQDVDAALALETAATLDAVEAVAAGNGRAPALQRTADEAAWSTARLLAVGVATDRGLGLAGSPATELRGRLTGLLTEHVLLAGTLAADLDRAGGAVQDPAVQATGAALEASAVALAELAGRSVPEAAEPVLAAWREHLRDVRAHATARAGGQPPPPPGPDYLERLHEALGPQAGAAPPRATDVGATAAASLRAGLDAAATGDGTAPEALRRAASDTTAVAALVSSTLAEQLQLS